MGRERGGRNLELSLLVCFLMVGRGWWVAAFVSWVEWVGLGVVRAAGSWTWKFLHVLHGELYTRSFFSY
jgi:hypothetical protein